MASYAFNGSSIRGGDGDTGAGFGGGAGVLAISNGTVTPSGAIRRDVERTGERIGRAVVRAWVLLALAFGGAGGAWAQNFDFSYQVNGINVAGTFVTTAQGNGSYLITSIVDGLRGSNAITLLAPGTGPQFFAPNDNILNYPANPGYFTQGGFSYSSAGANYTLFFFNGDYFDYTGGGSADNAGSVTVTAPAPAPHPGGGGLSFLALGLFGLVHSRRRIVGRVRALFAGLGARPSTPPTRTTLAATLIPAADAHGGVAHAPAR